MNILCLTYRFPYPPITGDRHRAIRHIKMLSKRHNVSLITFYQSENELKNIKEVKRYCDKIFTLKLSTSRSWLNLFKGIYRSEPFNALYFKSKKMERLIKDVLRNYYFDIVYVGSIRMAGYFLNTDGVTKIVDFGDCVTLHFKRKIKHEGLLFSILSKEELRRVTKYEVLVHGNYNWGVVSSQVDKMAFPKNEKIDVVPTFYDFNENEGIKEDYQPCSIIFSGNVGYYSDEIAILYFAREIFPLIQKEVPDARFYIVGANPSYKVKRLADDNDHITVTGYVDNIQEYIKKACVSVAPMRVGAGILCKIVEAMSLGVPVVTTTIGNGGIQGVNGREILIADSPQDFAKKVIHLFNDPMFREKIVYNAREFVRKRFSEDAVLEKMEETLKKAIG